MNQNLLDKYQGCLLGLAIGDALGVPAEFKKVGEFEPITDYRYCEHFDLPPGHWSDDTAMALCLAQSLIEKQGFDAVDQMQKYKQWFETGYCSSTGRAVGVGQNIMRALLNYRDGDDPYAAVETHHSEGNGSLMRIAPIPLYFRNDPVIALKNAALSSQITHTAKVCTDSCGYYAGLIVGALNGASKDELLSELYCPIPNYWTENELAQEVATVARGSFKDPDLSYTSASGHVVKTMETALWGFYTIDTLEEGMLKVINLGGDTDTVGAVYGQLAGAYYGLSDIPEQWVERVASRDVLQNITTKLKSR